MYRDADDPVFATNEFRSMIERAPALVPMPDLLRYLLEYPAATLEGSSDVFYWQEAQCGLKPTIRMNRVIVQDCHESIVIARGEAEKGTLAVLKATKTGLETQGR